MRPTITLRDALSDPHLLGHVLAGDSWRSWTVLLIAAMGEPLTDEERVVFKQLTGREREPLQRVSELAAVVGRRGGKTSAMGALATYLRFVRRLQRRPRPWRSRRVAVRRSRPARRQKAARLCQGQSRRQPNPRAANQEPNARQAIELTNGINIEVRPASFRKLRGPTYIAMIADELAFWFTDAELRQRQAAQRHRGRQADDLVVLWFPEGIQAGAQPAASQGPACPLRPKSSIAAEPVT